MLDPDIPRMSQNRLILLLVLVVLSHNLRIVHLAPHNLGVTNPNSAPDTGHLKTMTMKGRLACHDKGSAPLPGEWPPLPWLGCAAGCGSSLSTRLLAPAPSGRSLQLALSCRFSFASSLHLCFHSFTSCLLASSSCLCGQQDLVKLQTSCLLASSSCLCWH